MSDSLLFYLSTTTLSYLFFKRNKNVGVIISIFFFILSLIDFICSIITGNHITFLNLAKIDFSTLKMGIIILPFFSLFVLLVICFISFTNYKIFYLKKESIEKKNKLFVILLFLALVSFYLSETRVAYQNLIADYRKYMIIQSYDVDEICKQLGAKAAIKTTLSSNIAQGKNLVMIYCESLETNFYDQNQFPIEMTNLHNLQNQKWLLYNNYNTIIGSDWTFGALYATQTGLPCMFFNVQNSEANSIKKMPLTLAKVLKSASYDNVFISAANNRFANQGSMIEKCGYKIVEIKETISDYKENEWGCHDYDLFRTAKIEYASLSKSQKPFNLTLLTIDTHFPKGLPDKRLREKIYKNINISDYEFALASLDFLIYDFIQFAKQQPNYDKTVFVIIGDHPVMGNSNETPVIKKFKKDKRTTFLMTNQKIKNKDKDSYIAFYDIPQLILELVNVQSHAEFGKQIFPSLSEQFIKDNYMWFFMLNQKVCSF